MHNSTVTPQAFYFAWEDLLVGGDNDFDDLEAHYHQRPSAWVNVSAPSWNHCSPR